MLNVNLQIKLINSNCKPYIQAKNVFIKSNNTKLISIGQHQIVDLPIGIACSLTEGYTIEIETVNQLMSKGLNVLLNKTDDMNELMVSISNISNEPYHLAPFSIIGRIIIRQNIVPTVNYISGIQEGE